MPAAATDRGSTQSASRLLWGLALGFLALRMGFGYYEGHHPPLFQSLIDWVPAEQALQVSTDRRAPVLFVFSASWCEPCKQMEREVFSDVDLARQINETFVPVHVVEGGRPGLVTAEEAADLQKLYQVGSYPTLVVANADDRDPVTKTGYAGKAETRRFLLGGWRKKQVPSSFKDIMAQVKRGRPDGGMSDGGLQFRAEEYDLPEDGGE
jgi:thiol-disulfide isomerase/thioredoxin